MSRPIFEFTGRFSAEDLADVAHLTRPRFYWLLIILQSWHGLLLLVGIAWATILGLIGRTDPMWWAVGVIWAVVVGIFVWSAYSVKRDAARHLELLNETLLDAVTFTTEGVAWTSSHGTTPLVEWRRFIRWRERPRVIALDWPDGLIILPIAHLQETERQRLRDFLRSQISTPAPVQ